MMAVKKLLNKDDMSYAIIALVRKQTDLNDITPASVILRLIDDGSDVGNVAVMVSNKLDILPAMINIKPFDSDDRSHVALFKKCLSGIT